MADKEKSKMQKKEAPKLSLRGISLVYARESEISSKPTDCFDPRVDPVRQPVSYSDAGHPKNDES